jgi:hypothetical protein
MTWALQRREFITFLAAAMGSPASAQSENERPKEGDLLVANDSEGAVPLQLNDIPVGGPPVLAWPMDPVSNTVRKSSRLNKVLLVRLDPATLVGITRERAADGVVAYSAICPRVAQRTNYAGRTEQIGETFDVRHLQRLPRRRVHRLPQVCGEHEFHTVAVKAVGGRTY